MNVDQTFLFASAIIKDNKGKILLLKRSSKNKHFKGYWQLPEGKIKKNESPLGAIRRELREELQFKPSNIQLRKILIIPVQIQKLNMLLIKAVFTTQDYPRKIIMCKDHEKCKFYSLDAMNKLKLAPGTKEVLIKL